jgi:hypothetical protein
MLAHHEVFVAHEHHVVAAQLLCCRRLLQQLGLGCSPAVLL